MYRVLDVTRQCLNLISRYPFLKLLVKLKADVLMRGEFGGLSLRQTPKLLDGGDTVLPVELPRRLRANPPHPRQLEYSLDVRFMLELFEFRQLTRREKLANLIPHRGSLLRKRGGHRRIAQLCHVIHHKRQAFHGTRHLLMVPRFVRVGTAQHVLVYRREFLERGGYVRVQVHGSRGGRALAREFVPLLTQPRPQRRTLGTRSIVYHHDPCIILNNRRRRVEAQRRRDVGQR